ncbi:HAD family hydrolase [Muriicola sp. Z0-33]|uniref:HAD family hydrolase n=1 Tax=Muriicola sp. Z0-33 TaxID=2816957 RepID=UPI0022381A9D|nr:HAD family hydrolase [Muriicola sp. Z0-33]MCW5517298.1 HAD family phosphatase [Muriicola sp. Z0-33]
MDFSGIKLVVTDMDGTLLNSDHKVSSHFFKLFHQLKEHNVLFAAASGRQYSSIADKLQPIKEDIIIIAENGGFAVENGIELVSTPLEPDFKGKILSVLDHLSGIHPVLCTKNRALLRTDSSDFIEQLKEYYTEFELVDDLNTYEGEVMKIAVYHPENSEKFIYPAVRHFESDLKVKVSGENWVDLSHINAHKGFALQLIQDRYNITPEETMVFGDYNNDLEMMALAEFSFAMANSHANVLKIANFRTDSNNEFGVEKVLDKLLTSKN